MDVGTDGLVSVVGFDARSGALKLNGLIQCGVNDDQLLPLVDLARQRRVELR